MLGRSTELMETVYVMSLPDSCPECRKARDTNPDLAFMNSHCIVSY